MKSAHTPGPLTVHQGVLKAFSIYDSTKKLIGSAYGEHGLPADANARLWAASPKLLEALKAIRDHDQATCNGLTPNDCIDKMRELARAAVAEVEGE